MDYEETPINKIKITEVKTMFKIKVKDGAKEDYKRAKREHKEQIKKLKAQRKQLKYNIKQHKLLIKQARLNYKTNGR